MVTRDHGKNSPLKYSSFHKKNIYNYVPFNYIVFKVFSGTL